MLYTLHGFTESDEVWQDVLRDKQLDHKCLLLPGHGSKPCPANSDMESIAAELAAELPAEGVDLMGYSMGGRIALRIALDHPNKVKRLILISSSPGVRDDNERQERLKRDDALAEILEEDGIGAFVAWWENNPAIKVAKALNPDQEATLRSRRLNHDPAEMANACRCLGQGRMEPLWDRLPELDCPCLLIAGSHDKVYKDMLRDAAELISNATLRIIPVAGHAVHREQPDALIELLQEFIKP